MGTWGPLDDWATCLNRHPASKQENDKRAPKRRSHAKNVLGDTWRHGPGKHNGFLKS